MRNEYYLLHILGVTSESRVKFVDSILGISSPSPSPPSPTHQHRQLVKGGDFDVILILYFWSRCLMSYIVLSSLLFTILM